MINRLKENSTYFGLAVLVILAIRVFMPGVDISEAVTDADKIINLLAGIGMIAMPEVKRGES